MVATHNLQIAQLADQVLRVQDGRLTRVIVHPTIEEVAA